MSLLLTHQLLLNEAVSHPLGGPTAYANEGGMGDRTSFMTAALGGTWTGVGSVQATINGVNDNTFFFTGGGDGGWIQFDFGAGANKLINEITWQQDLTSSHGSDWYAGVSNNGTVWDDFVTDLTIGGAAENIVPFTNANHHGRFFRLGKAAGNPSGAPFLQEMTFKITDW